MDAETTETGAEPDGVGMGRTLIGPDGRETGCIEAGGSDAGGAEEGLSSAISSRDQRAPRHCARF
jgi:hypothetical protein